MFGRRKLAGGRERRRYLRLDTVFPVQARLESPDKKQILSQWVQGFTSNVSRGGICLAVNNLPDDAAKLIKEKKANLFLEITLPIIRRPVDALANIAWVKEPLSPGVNHTLIGLDYIRINPKHNILIMRYAWGRRIFKPLVISLVIILGIGLAGNAYLNYRLTKNNQTLAEELAGVLRKARLAKDKIRQSAKQREFLQSKINWLESEIGFVTTQEANKKPFTSGRSKEINELIIKLTQEKNSFAQKLINLRSQEALAIAESSRLEKKQAALEKVNLDKMYNWLKVHQNLNTGLSISFEGDKDISNWAFTYDQALLIQVYAHNSDFGRAKKLLNFFAKSAKRQNGWFLNAYYASDGEPAEFIMHSGPNIWLGIAIMQYASQAQDKSYLYLAESIARCIINLQKQDPDGGIRGGPQFTWYSTEHNLDAYAFFNMLFKATRDNKYKQAADTALDWLLRHTYTHQDILVKRGKGDSTIATDTYAWSIAAIGPQKLKEIGMDPDKIMEFAEENCSVEVNFVRPNGQTVRVKGFDFAPLLHVARGGVVSSEWTAQMVVSYKIMAGYYYQKNNLERAHVYEDKANSYLAQLGNMLICSSSASGQGEGCLPYATQDFVDTGHGWMTPKGSNTGAVSGTAYTIFAYHGYNPLGIKE